jgi:adenylate cyclase
MSDAAPGAYLEAKVGGELRQFPLDGDRPFRIGRSDKTNLVVDDDLASRQHAMLQRSDGDLFYITDLGSSNGTFVNGARISTPVILKPGDRITIGSYEFRFCQDHACSAPADENSALQSTSLFFAQKLITVLVVDIRNFTGLAQQIDAGKLSQVTGTFFRQAGKALQERGACAQKYIGDAVMAVWLHKGREPQPSELMAVFDGLSKMAAIADGLQANFGLESQICIGAGVNTGWASVGNVGSIASSDYTALGDVVNKTFRLESSTKEMACDLALGQETYDVLASSFDAGKLFTARTVKLKGYNEAVTAYAAQMACLPSVLEHLQAVQDYR